MKQVTIYMQNKYVALNYLSGYLIYIFYSVLKGWEAEVLLLLGLE